MTTRQDATLLVSPSALPVSMTVFRIFVRISFTYYYRNWVSLFMSMGVPLIFLLIYLIPLSFGGNGTPELVVALNTELSAQARSQIEKSAIPGVRFTEAKGVPEEIIESQQAKIVVSQGPAGNELVVRSAPADKPVAELVARAVMNAKNGDFGDLRLSVETLAPTKGVMAINAGTITAGILIMSILNLGLFTAGVKLLQDRSAGALRLYRNFPVPFSLFIAAELYTKVILLVVQVVLLLLLAMAAYGLEVSVLKFVATLMTAVLCGIPMVLMGYALAATLPNFSKGVHLFTIVNLLSCFLGDLFFPTSSVEFLRPIVFITPVAHAANLIRIVLADAAPTFPLVVSVGYLGVFSTVSFLVIAKYFKYSAKE